MTTNNPSAFPRVETTPHAHVDEGMTLRDYFAGQAIAAKGAGDYFSNADLASDCYKLADAMIAARGVPEKASDYDQRIEGLIRAAQSAASLLNSRGLTVNGNALFDAIANVLEPQK